MGDETSAAQTASDGLNPPRDLGKRAARGAAVTMIGQVLRIAIQSIGVIVMARILVPADFGLLAMVIAIVGIGEILRDFGLAAAAVQAPDLSVKQRSNLFWLNASLGLTTGAVAFLLSWPIAALYDDQRLVAITQIVSITFVFNGLASQYRANLQRSLAFTSLVLAELVGLTAGVSAAIVGGIAGWGYWALVCQFVINSLAVLVVLVALSRWLPRGFYRNQNTRHFIRFGTHMLGYQVLTYASKNIDTIVIGQRFGATALGYYNRAFQLLTLPLSQIASPLLRVAIPVLSKVQYEERTFNSYLAKSQAALLSVMFFALVSLAALSDPIVTIVLGSDWLPSSDLFRILAIAGIFQMLSYPALWGFVSLGLTKANLVQALIARPLLIALVIGGALFSVQGVAWGYAIGNFVAWPIALFFLARSSFIDVRTLTVSALRMLVANVFGGAVAFSATMLLPFSNPWAVLAIGIAVMVGATSAAAAAIPSLRVEYGFVFRAARNAARKGGGRFASDDATI